MHRRRSVLVAATTTAFLTATFGVAAPLATAEPANEATYLVLFSDSGAKKVAQRAIAEAGGTITGFARFRVGA